jgi:hypothetical protein
MEGWLVKGAMHLGENNRNTAIKVNKKPRNIQTIAAQKSLLKNKKMLFRGGYP